MVLWKRYSKLYNNKDNNCKYGVGCHFAHGETELKRSNEQPSNINSTMNNFVMQNPDPNIGYNQPMIQSLPMFTYNNVFDSYGNPNPLSNLIIGYVK